MIRRIVGFVVSVVGLTQVVLAGAQSEVYLESWDTVTYNDEDYITLKGTNGALGAVPRYKGTTPAEAEDLLRGYNLLDHERLYDSLVASGVSQSVVAAVDELCYDLHARMLGVPFHEFLGTRRRKIRRYGDHRWREGDTPESYAGRLANLNLQGTKLHFPGHYPIDSYMGYIEGMPVDTIKKVLRLCREVRPDLTLAYDPHPQKAIALEDIDTVRKVMSALDSLGYEWVEAPLPPKPEFQEEYAILRDEFDLRIQNEEGSGADSYEDFRSWVDAGAVDQWSCDARLRTVGITPILRMMRWCADNPESGIHMNLHYNGAEHLHLAMAADSSWYPWFESPYSGEGAYVLAPNHPGIYDLPWLESLVQAEPEYRNIKKHMMRVVSPPTGLPAIFTLNGRRWQPAHRSGQNANPGVLLGSGLYLKYPDAGRAGDLIVHVHK